MITDECVAAAALNRVFGFKPTVCLEFINELGSARVVFNLKKDELDEIIDSEAYMLCGISKTFKFPIMWYEPLFGYTYTIEIDEFIDCYKKSARLLGAGRAKNIEIDRTVGHIKLILEF